MHVQEQATATPTDCSCESPSKQANGAGHAKGCPAHERYWKAFWARRGHGKPHCWHVKGQCNKRPELDGLPAHQVVEQCCHCGEIRCVQYKIAPDHAHGRYHPMSARVIDYVVGGEGACEPSQEGATP